MTKIAPLAAALLLALPAASASKVLKSESTRARSNLASYVTSDDYPVEAILNGEQGTVGFRIRVGSDGNPTSCSIVSSSGSSSLDSTTCRIMMERARFEPARDARGKAVPDQASGRIRWVLPDAPTGAELRLETARALWSSCVIGEAAKSVPPCEPLEALVAKELGQSMPLTEQRDSILGSLSRALQLTRAALNSPDDVEPSKPQP